jgi:hypothetical protein
MILFDYRRDDYSQKRRFIMARTASKKRPTGAKRRTSAPQTFARPPVLSKEALALGKKIAGNRDLAIEFLKKSGFIEKPGKLARPYR